MYQNIFVSSRSDFQEPQVYLWDDEEGLITAPYSEFAYAYKPDDGGDYISIRGERLRKVDRFKWDDHSLFESDLPRETRVLTDLYLDSDMPSTGHIILNFDIENDTTGGFSKPSEANGFITAIANHLSTTDHYTVFMLDPDKQILNRTVDNKTVISCGTEVELLEKWLEYYHAAAPTILTGWNIDGYDIPYLYNRLKRVFNQYTADSLSPVGLIKYSEQRERFQIAGVSALDYITLYKKFTYGQRPSYRLDAIGQYEVGMGKIEYEGTLNTLYRDDINKFLDYNLRDVEIVQAIDKKMKLIELARFICHLGHVPYEDFGYSSKFIEGTIVTYLHRKGIVVPNKPKGGRELMNQKAADGEEGFAGAFVKPPYPGLYEWVYSLDLQSLYPSIIMSLNISPDTKAGIVANWDVAKHVRGQIDRYEVKIGQERTVLLDRQQTLDLLDEKGYSISSNGVMYTTDKVGIVPEILDKWFAERVEYKDMMKRYVKEGNAELADFYDRRQHVQKILLNSIYGVLGLPIFRFYDLDNALAVTATGQDVIKTTAKFINSKYKAAGASPKTDLWVKRYWEVLKKDAKKRKPYVAPVIPSADDHCVYIDTDSVYFSAVPMFGQYNIESREPTPEETWQHHKSLTIQIAKDMESGVNKFYDVMAKMLFNCSTHRFYIKGEAVMDTGFWVAKKRYAMAKKYDLETDEDVDKLAVKGLDVVRSSFPPAFAKLMKEVLGSILKRKEKKDLDTIILDFHSSMKNINYLSIARNTSVKKVSEYDDLMETDINSFPKGAAAHSKAAVTYNRLIRKLGLEDKFMQIMDGDKIKWVYLKKNPYNIETVAIKAYDDPPQILDLVENYMDYNLLFEKELSNKLEDFYDALDWGMIPTKVNQNAFKFFDFN